MKRKLRFLLFAIILTNIISLPVYSEDNTPLPYEKDEFSQGLKDLRRFEIISLGAMPFVTLDTTLIYSQYRYVQSGYDPEYTPNPFATSTYSNDEQAKIILTALGISIGIGLADYFIQLIKRTRAEKRKKLLTYDDISIYPYETSDIETEDSFEDEVEIISSDIQEVEE